MSNLNHHGNQAFDQRIMAGLVFGTLVKTLGATFTMDRDMPTAIALDPGGSARDVLLPPEEEGLAFFIANAADADEDLVVKEDAGSTTIGTIDQNEAALLVCIGGVWRIAVGTMT